MTRASRQAGVQIEITEEMIEAGAKELAGWMEVSGQVMDSDRRMVAAIICAIGDAAVEQISLSLPTAFQNPRLKT